MPPRKTNINIKNPYNPMSSLYKKLTRLWAGPLVTKITPKNFDLGKRNLDKFQDKFKTATGQPFLRNDIKHPSYYLYMDTYVNSMRNERYIEFEQMEMHPDCAAVLETYADEMTSGTDLNPPIKIISNNLDIKECLNQLFYDVLNMPMNLYPLVYTLCKYGDLFCYLDIDDVEGVKNIIPLPCAEVERLEGQDETNPNYVQFQWNRAGQTYEYGWNVVHFRILASDKYAPYGQSVFDPARRAYHQISLLENAVIGYRIVRSPERRVFYIDIGGINDEDIKPFLEDVKKSLKQDTVTNPNSGQAEKRYSAMPVSKNTIVPLLDGRNISIEELAKEFDEGKENWVYSISDKTFEPLPGKVKWCGKNYKASKLIRVHLDDNSYIDTAPEHPFILKDGTNKRADELVENDALMPFYRENKKIRKETSEYESVYNNKTGKYEFTHRFVANDALKEQKENCLQNLTKLNKNLVIHHSSFNRFNNNPDKLQWMGNVDHIQLHSKLGKENIIKYNKSEKHRKTSREIHKKYDLKKYLIAYNSSEKHKEDNVIRSSAMKKSWETNEERMINHISLSKFNYSNDLYEYIKEFLSKSKEFISATNLASILELDIEFIKLLLNNNTGKRENCIKLHKNKIKKIIAENSNFTTYEEFILSLNKQNWIYPKNYKTEGIYKNHKVSKIEIIECNEDVYCMTVVGSNGENDRHNFACLGNYIDDNIEKLDGYNVNSGIFLRNSLESDYVIPVRGANSGTKIDTLPGGSYTGDIEDLKHARDKLFSGLGAPAAYYSQDSQEDRQALSSKDIKFGKRIQRMQNHVIAGLYEIAITHLYILGFRDEDLDNFEIKLSNPSKIAEMQELEQMRSRLDLANSASDYFSKETIYKKFLGLSDEEIQKELFKKYSDAKYDLSIQQFEDTGEGSLGGDLGGGGGLDSPLEGLSDAPSDENPFSDAPESEGDDSDNLLLSEPSDSDVSNLSQKKLKDDKYLTPGAKGKSYSKEKVDKRFAGARLRNMKANSPIASARASRKNLFGAGFEGFRSLSKGIVSEDLLNEMKDLHSFNESLINDKEK